MANYTGGKTQWPLENIGRISLLPVLFSRQKETLSKYKELFIFPVSTLILRKADPGLQSLLKKEISPFENGSSFFCCEQTPVLAISSHLRSQNILHGKVELLHQEGYSCKRVSFGGL